MADLLEADAIDEVLPLEPGDQTPTGGEEHIPEGAEGQPEGDDAKTPITSLFAADGKKLDPVVWATLQKIRAENPSVATTIIKSLHRVGEMDREFPGGLTEVRELREKVEEFGGIDGIQGKLDGAKELNTLADQFMAADPAFVEDMATSSPEAFAALAPQVFAKYAATSPEGFAAYVGRIVYGDMQKNNVPLLMMRLADVLGDNQRAVEVFNQLQGYLAGFQTLSEKPFDAPKPKAGAAQPKTDDLTRREEELRSKEWQTERNSAQKQIVDAEFNRALAGRKPDSEERAQIKELFLVRSNAAADRLFPGWDKKSAAFIKSGDKAGYLRYMQSIYRRVVPETIASSVNSTLKGKKAAAPGAAPVKPAAPGSNGTPVAAGFKPVGAEPDSYLVDYTRTTKAMIMQNRAVLKDGTRVAWK